MAHRRMELPGINVAIFVGVACLMATLDCDQILAQTVFGESESRVVEILPTLASAPDSIEIDESPHVEVTTPVISMGDSIRVNEEILRIEGRIDNVDQVATLEISFAPVDFDSDGNFSTSLTLRPGLNIPTIIARDSARAELIRKPLYVLYEDTSPPELRLASPRQKRFRSDFQLLQLEGTLSDQSSIVAFSVNDVPVELSDDNRFVTDVQLEEGTINIILLAAQDENGWTLRDSLKVAHDGSSPITPSLINELTIQRGSLVPTFNPFEQYYVVEPATETDSIGLEVRIGDLQSITIFGPGLPPEGQAIEPGSESTMIPVTEGSHMIEVRSAGRNAIEVSYYLRVLPGSD